MCRAAIVVFRWLTVVLTICLTSRVAYDHYPHVTVWLLTGFVAYGIARDVSEW